MLADPKPTLCVLAKRLQRGVGSVRRGWWAWLVVITAGLLSPNDLAAAVPERTFKQGVGSTDPVTRGNVRVPERVGRRLETRINTRIDPRSTAEFKSSYEVRAAVTNQAKTTTSSLDR